MVVSIKDLFAKYAKITPKERPIKAALIEAIFAETGLKLDATQVRIQNSTVFLHVHPLEKKEILEKQKKILEDVGKKFLQQPIISIQ